MERLLGIGRQGIELFQNGKLLGFQGVPAQAKQVQRLAIPKKDGLLALVDDELGPHAEVLDGVLPHQGLVVPLVLNDAGKAAVLDLLDHEPLGHVVLIVAHRADVSIRRLGRTQTHPTLGTGKFLHLTPLDHGVDRLMAHGAEGLLSLDWSNTTIFPQWRPLPPSNLVRADVDGVPAGAVYLLPGKKAGAGLGEYATVGRFNNEFCHNSYSPLNFFSLSST